MSETSTPRIPKEVIDLSPSEIARDRRLRELYEAILASKGTPEEAAARNAFAEFVREQYP